MVIVMKNLAKYLSDALGELRIFSAATSNSSLNNVSIPVLQEGTLSKQARALFIAGNLKSALDLANQLIAQEPKNPEGYQIRASSQLGLKNYGMALEDFNQTIALDPRYASSAGFIYAKSYAEYNLGMVDVAKLGMQKSADLFLASGDQKHSEQATSYLEKMNSGEPLEANT